MTGIQTKVFQFLMASTLGWANLALAEDNAAQSSATHLVATGELAPTHKTVATSVATTESGTEMPTLAPKVIYGRDNRLDLYQVQDPGLLKAAAATAALIKTNKLSPRPGQRFEIRTSSYADDYRLCQEEPFFDQQTAAFCSGFFVGGDLMVTAGHCIRTQSDCDSTSFVFGFGITKQGENPTSVPVDQVYKCKSIVQSQIVNNGADFAVVKVERQVTGRAPATLRQSGHAEVGDELVVIGHPVGLPTKVAGEGIVRAVQNEFLVAGLDTYGGNSGSAVFNMVTGEVEGILVRGEMDFKSVGACHLSNTCATDGCRGEDVTRIDFVNDAIRRAK